MTKKIKYEQFLIIRALENILSILVIMLMFCFLLIMYIGELEIKMLENKINMYDHHVYEERIPVKEAFKNYISSLPLPAEEYVHEEMLLPKNPSVEGILPTVTTLNTSAYCSCEKCCGKTDGITASGEKATAWYTVAAGKKYEIGTIIYIPALENTQNEGWFVVQDRGGAISDDKLDIFLNTHSEALEFGRKDLECYVFQF